MRIFACRLRSCRSSILRIAGTLTAIFALSLTVCVSAQTQSSAAPTYEYEVATILPSKPGGNGVGLLPSPDGLIARKATLQMLVTAAYGVEKYQVSGGPSWFTSDTYDIDAKMEPSVADALQKLTATERTKVRRQMLQKLLADRFSLTVRQETSELPIYSLVVTKNGPKIKQATPGDSYANGLRDRNGNIRGAGATFIGVKVGALTLTGQSVPIANLVDLLARYVDRPIVDKTGLAGNYDFYLQFTTNQGALQASGSDASSRESAPTDTNAPYLLAAVQEQLGLKLESGRGPAETIAIDHVERPSSN